MQKNTPSNSAPQLDPAENKADHNFAHLRGPACAVGLVALAGIVAIGARKSFFSRPLQNYSSVATVVDTFRIDFFDVDSDGTIVAHIPRFHTRGPNSTELHMFRNNKWSELPSLPPHRELVNFTFRPDTHAPLALIHATTTGEKFLNEVLELSNDEWISSKTVGGFYGENLLRAGEFLVMRDRTDVGDRSALSVFHKGSWTTIDAAPFNIEKLSCAVAWNGGLVVGGDIRNATGNGVGVLYIKGSEVTAFGGGLSFSKESLWGTIRPAEVYSLVLMDGEVYAIGNFTGSGSSSFSFPQIKACCQRIAYYDGTQWIPFPTAIVEQPLPYGVPVYAFPVYHVLSGHNRIVVVAVPPYALQIGEHTGAGIFECFADGNVRYPVVLSNTTVDKQAAAVTPEGDVFFKQEPVRGRDEEGDVQILKLLQK